MTKFDQMDAPLGRLKLVTQLPSTPRDFYGVLYGIALDTWQGGELVYHNGSDTGGNHLYIQTATSGTSPTWKTISTQFETYP